MIDPITAFAAAQTAVSSIGLLGVVLYFIGKKQGKW
jgi:hypothetical protein